MSEPRHFSFEFSGAQVAGLEVSAPEDAALRLGRDDEDTLTLMGNAEGLMALARALVLLAQPEAAAAGARVRLEQITDTAREGLPLALHRNDRRAEWPDADSGGNKRVTDLLRDQGLVRLDDAYALLLKNVGDRPLAAYTVLKSKLGMPSEEVVRIGDNAPLVVKTYRDLVSAQSDADEIARAGGTAVPVYFKRAMSNEQ